MEKQGRVYFLDEARGLSILLMVLHHAGYDMVTLLHWPLDFLSSGWFELIRLFFACVFVFISGCACRFSRSNLKRGIRCLVFALALSLVTGWIAPAQRIRFGILHLLGSGMILFSLLRPVLDRISPVVGGLSGLGLYFLTFSAAQKWVGIGAFRLALPDNWFQNGWTAALGFPGPSYYSADYFPLVPWLFLFFGGSFAGIYLKERRGPAWLYQKHSSFLCWAGQHSIWIYLLHQPILYPLFWALSFL